MYLADAMRSAGREISAIARGGSPTHAKLRDRLTVMLIVTVAIDLICAVLALIFERHVPNTQIQSFGSAFFWTSTQLLTVSSQIQNPMSVGGRILDIAMEAYAITIVATLAGAFGSFMVRRAHELEAAATAEKR
jgi:hypothetical protein